MALTAVGTTAVFLIAGDEAPVDWTYAERTGWTQLLLGTTEDPEVTAIQIRAGGKAVVATHVADVFGHLGRVAGWMGRLDMVDLIDWKVPTHEQFAALSWEPEPVETAHTWLFDRFSQTYLDSWHTSSLKREFRYMHGQEPGACSPSQMRTRRIKKEDLAEEIARRFASDDDGADGAGVGYSGKYVGVAVDLLKKGERASATAIFDVVCRTSPRSADAFNNRGFCRLPDEPAEALTDFEHAMKLGAKDFALTVANRVLALHRLDRNATALEVAEETWGALRKSNGTSYLWDFTKPDAVLIEVEDCRAYLADLAATVAESSGDSARGIRWRERLAEISESP